jgi:hemoglobin-like flavoprotein
MAAVIWGEGSHCSTPGTSFHVTSPFHPIIMTTEQRELVKATFAQVAPISEVAAELFYNRLFELDPTLREMFPADLKEQGRKLMQMLAMIVSGLDRLDTLAPAVEDLGRRHVSYDVRADHYPTVGNALLWTLEKGLGESFTDDVREAWTAAFALLTMIMTGAAATVESEAAAV